MRCSHCRGEIPKGSRFCGVCGRSVDMPLSPEAAASTTHMPSGGYSSAGRERGDSSASLFELPVSPGAKRLRIALIALLNLLLLGGAAALVLGYFGKRDKAAAEELSSRACVLGVDEACP